MPPQFEMQNTPSQSPFYPPLWLWLIIILAGLLGSAQIYLSIYQEVLRDTDTQTLQKVDEFADWKTYRNDEYGFEFKYPNSWIDTDHSYGLDVFQINTENQKYNFFVQKNDKTGVGPLDDPSCFKEIKKITFNNLKWSLNEEECGEGGGIGISAFLYRDNLVFRILLETKNSLSKSIEDLNQILSTFKFISTSTSATSDSNWKVYSNEKFGFSIKYPELTMGGKTQVIEHKGAIYMYPEGWPPGSDYLDRGEEDKFRGKWAIVVRKISNENAIDDFVKEKYGKDCTWKFEKRPNSIETDIVITSFYPPEEDQPDCFVNWITVMKFNRDFGKLAVWDIGQDSSFRSNENTPEIFDAEMADSFKFTK